MADSKVVLVTGGNTGLGLEIVKSLCRSSNHYTILLGSRTLSNGESAAESVRKEFPSTKSTITPIQVDLNSDESIEKAIDTITSEHGRIDTLLNNGGASFDVKLNNGEISIRDAFNASWDTNVTGTQILTWHAVPLLLKSSDPRLIFMTSGTASLGETEKFDGPMYQRLNGSPAAGWPKDKASLPLMSYRSTKTGLNMLMREWSKTLKEDGVKVWCISPGFLATGLAGVGAEALRKLGALDPQIGADFTVSVVEGKRDHDVGKLIRKDMVQPW